MFRRPKLDAARFLIVHGARLDAKDIEGRAALHIAAYGSESIVRMLVFSGAKINATENTGATPLHLAAMSKSTEIILLLLGHEAIVGPCGD